MLTLGSIAAGAPVVSAAGGDDIYTQTEISSDTDTGTEDASPAAKTDADDAEAGQDNLEKSGSENAEPDPITEHEPMPEPEPTPLGISETAAFAEGTFVISTQEDFEELVAQANEDCATQQSEFWDTPENLTPSQLGSNPVIILQIDVTLPDGVSSFQIPYDVETLTIQGNGHIMSGGLQTNVITAKVTLENINVQSEFYALEINTGESVVLEINGEVTLSGGGYGVSVKGEVSWEDGTYVGPRSGVSVNVGQGDSLQIEAGYIGVYGLGSLSLNVDGGSLEIAAETNPIHMDGSVGWGSIFEVNATNGGTVSIISIGGFVYAATGFKIDLSKGARFELEGGVYTPSPHGAPTCSISATKNSVFLARAEGWAGLAVEVGCDFHVDDSIFILISKSDPISYASNKTYTGAPAFFLVESLDGYGPVVYPDEASLLMTGKMHGMLDLYDDEGNPLMPTPYYAIVGTPVLAKNPSTPDVITTTTNNVLLDVSKLADWDTTEVTLTYTFNDGPVTVSGLTVNRTGSNATVDVSSFLTAVGTYKFTAAQEVDGYDSYLSNEIEFTVKPTYTVTYDANGATSGAVPVDETEYYSGDTVTLLYNTGSLQRDGYVFIGWGLTDSSGTTLSPGTKITVADSDLYFYARWSRDSGGGGGGGGGGSREDEYDIPDEDVPLTSFTTDHVQYIQGYPDNSVRPEGNLTRSEAAAIFYRLSVSEDKDQSFTVSYTDMNSNDWYYKEVAYLSAHGIILGYEDGTFRGDAPITRAEFAAMVSRYDALWLDDTNDFSDVSESHWAVAYINSAASKGWIEGYPDRTFRPDANITRAETVTLINRVLGRLVEAEDLPEGVRVYTDIDKSHWAYYDIMEASHTHEYDRKEDRMAEIWTEYEYETDKQEFLTTLEPRTKC